MTLTNGSKGKGSALSNRLSAVLAFCFAAILGAILLSASFTGTAFADDDRKRQSENAFEIEHSEDLSISRLLASTEGIEALKENAISKKREHTIDTLMENALAKVGLPYIYGGTTLRGFDCSGFVQYVYRETTGMELPRTAGGQSAMGTSVALSEMQPGDLIFWGRGYIHHVGMYIGDGKYVHAAGTGKGVRIDNVADRSPGFAKRIL